jgi:hypothetical protein
MAPNDTYDADKSFRLLSLFKESEILDAISLLKRQQTVARAAKLPDPKDRKLPGRHLQLSEKFTSALNGALASQTFREASKFADEFSSFPESLPLEKSPGIMAILLECFCFDKVRLRPLLPEGISSELDPSKSKIS